MQWMVQKLVGEDTVGRILLYILNPLQCIIKMMFRVHCFARENLKHEMNNISFYSIVGGEKRFP